MSFLIYMLVFVGGVFAHTLYKKLEFFLAMKFVPGAQAAYHKAYDEFERLETEVRSKL